jgi:DNA invertase Pin-like site-specific DNA recombinase
MRVFAYTRVSSADQTRGASLGDQTGRIEQWLRENDHSLIANYSEHGSGGSAKNRKTFTQMMLDLSSIRPEVLIVDSADRFTRNTLDGGRWVSHITDLGVGLAIIEHDEGRLLDMRTHADRAFVANAFLIADAERDRMAKRQLKRYAATRAAGATTTNRPSWGLILAEGQRGRRRLMTDPRRGSVIAEVDRRILSGESVAKVVEWLKVEHPGSWSERSSLAQMLRDEQGSYVSTGARAAETQSRLREMFSERRHIFGRDRRRSVPVRNALETLERELRGETGERPPLRDHPLAGVLACGLCVAAGRRAESSLMTGYYVNGNSQPFALSCIGRRNGKRVHRRWSVGVHRIIPLLFDKLEKLRDPRVLDACWERWSAEPVTPQAASQRTGLERLLASCDEEEATIEIEVTAAFRLISSPRPGVVAEAERLLERCNANRLALAAKRSAILSRIADLPAPRVRLADRSLRRELSVNAEELLTGYQIDPATGAQWVQVDVQAVLRKWGRLIGPPVLSRLDETTHGAPLLRWDFIDSV